MISNCYYKCNVFKFDDIYDQQFRRFAKGNRLAFILAIAYMEYIESHCISGDLIYYKRFIDDTIVIARNQITLYNAFNAFNDVNMNVKFTWKKADDSGWLHFLDLKLS